MAPKMNPQNPFRLDEWLHGIPTKDNFGTTLNLRYIYNRGWLIISDQRIVLTGRCNCNILIKRDIT